MAKDDKKGGKEKSKSEPLFDLKGVSKNVSKVYGNLEDHNTAMLGFFGQFLSLGGILLIIMELLILKFLEIIGVIKILIWNL